MVEEKKSDRGRMGGGYMECLGLMLVFFSMSKKMCGKKRMMICMIKRR